MTEKEKCAAGMLYKPFLDKQLSAELMAAKEACFEINNTKPREGEKIKSLIKKLFGKVGENCFVTPPFFCDYGYNITVGDNFFANHNCVILDCNKVTIGNNVLIAPNVTISAATHPVSVKTRAEGLEYALPITIGDDVWIAANVSIMPGVSIGAGSIIGAGSVVTKDIPSGVIAFGCPCKVIRKIED